MSQPQNEPVDQPEQYCETSTGKTPEVNLAALIVGALVCQDVISIDNLHTLDSQLVHAVRVVAACLRGRLDKDHTFDLPFEL